MFDSDGKQATREIVSAYGAAIGCRTLLDLFGDGDGASYFAKAGFAVTAAEIRSELWPHLRRASAANGYKPFFGDVQNVRRHHDIACADMLGSFRTSFAPANHMASISDALAVTICPDHNTDEMTQVSPMFGFRVAAWMYSVAPTMRLLYLTSYTRTESDRRYWMWFAVLGDVVDRRLPERRRPRRVQHLNPVTIERDLEREGWWAAHDFRDLLGRKLLRKPHNPVALCPACGAEVPESKSRYGQSKTYCSEACGRLTQRGIQVGSHKVCRGCSKTFTVGSPRTGIPGRQRNADFCSRKCYAAWHRRGGTERPLSCIACGEALPPGSRASRKYCTPTCGSRYRYRQAA